MFSGENIDWKEEGEIPEYSEGLAQLWADLSPTNLEFLQSLDPAFIGGSQPGFNKASFPNFPGAKECKYNAYRATYQKRNEELQPRNRLTARRKKPVQVKLSGAALKKVSRNRVTTSRFTMKLLPAAS